MKRIHFLIPMSALMLAACASAPTPTPTAAPALTPTLELTIEPSFPAFLLAYSSPETLADTPPELTYEFGGEVKGISQADIDYLVAWEVYQKLYREEQGPTVWSEAEFLEKFVPEMLSYLDKKSGIELIVQQDADSGKVLVALVKKSGNTKSVYWDFDGSVLANTNPMSLDADFSDDPGLVHLKPGLSPQFRFNPVDGHWYMFAVDADGEAVEWFATNGATEDNQEKQWKEVPKKSELFTLGYSPAMNEAMAKLEIQEDYTKLLYADGTQVPMGFLGKVGSEYVFSGVLTDVINLSDSNPDRFSDWAKGVVLNMILPGGGEVRVCLIVYPNPLTIMTEPVSTDNWYETKHRRINGHDSVVEMLRGQGVNDQVIFTINSVGVNSDTDKVLDLLMKLIDQEKADLGVLDMITDPQLGVIWMPE